MIEKLKFPYSYIVRLHSEIIAVIILDQNQLSSCRVPMFLSLSIEANIFKVDRECPSASEQPTYISIL